MSENLAKFAIDLVTQTKIGMSQNLFEKLQYEEEKNVLIQGLPYSIEKQFVKIAFSKNITPLLKIRKVDFALIFALSVQQLNQILEEVLPAFHQDTKLWIAYPKSASKIVSDLNRDCSWEVLRSEGYCLTTEVEIDHVWSTLRFEKEVLVEIEEEEILGVSKENYI